MATIKQHQIIDTSDVDDATKQHTMIELETGCMSDFPQTMIIDILSRLSVNVLCKFKCVSKDWFNLISSDPYFKKLHYAQSVRNPTLLSLYPFKSSEKKKIVNATTMDKTNGLVFIPWEIDPGYRYYYSHCDQNTILLVSNERITICNPSTREIVSVLDSYCVFFTLFNHTYGFGLNPYTKEYKVARISYYEMNDKYHICSCGCQITTLPISERTERDDKYHKCGCQITTMPISERTDDDVVAWRCISDCPVSEVLDFHGSSVTSSGVIYWLISQDHGENYSILALDLESEKFRIISLPEDYLSSNPDMVQLVSMNGFLGVVYNFFLHSATMEIWKLKDQENVNWVKEFSTNSFPLVDDIEIKGFISSDCCNDQLLIYSEQKGFFYYNFHTNTLRGAGRGYCLDSFLYFDNLFPLGR